MEVYLYEIELQDFLFFAQEAVSGTVTPRWLHATAINYALAYAMNAVPDQQPYFMCTSGGRNVPAYDSSFIPGVGFYATAARMTNSEKSKMVTFLVKGDSEGYGYVTGKGGEVLRVSTVSMLPPGTLFRGFILGEGPQKFPQKIRLGRFRSPARLVIHKGEIQKECRRELVDHPVDPLVSKTKRGVLVPLLPYPLVDKACVERCLCVEFKEVTFCIAIPDKW